MSAFEIVAHRGDREKFPENSIPAFQSALEQGADAIEFDVRLTADLVPVVYHYAYLENATSFRGPIFQYTLSQLKKARLVAGNCVESDLKIPTLEEVVETFGRKIGLEIHIKGPELKSSSIVSETLANYVDSWETIEVTSYEPMLLHGIQQRCQGLATDLLFPLTENWMKPDVIAYEAV